ncbi:gamma carbonic anhydrase family protein [candidate division WOR-3 bacterium]|nr:gamma carbonic anhydrase family protein [candidate division WOR-3 bacterium]
MGRKGPLFIADNVSIIGDVRMGNNVNIWYGAVLRADLNYIEIGDNTNIQDNAVLHVERDLPTIVGSNVTVGHGAIIHGANISSNVLIGMGAIILNNSRIGKGCVIGAGALVKENEKSPPFSLVVGIPGKVKKKLDESILQTIKISVEEYIELARKRIEKDY